MKKLHLKIQAIRITSITLVCILFHNCSTSNRIYSRSDIVTSTKRIELKYSVKDHDRRSPLFYFTQSVVKEINPENEVLYTAYDVLSLSASSFRLDEKAYFLIDNEACPVVIDRMELENVRNISEDTENILRSDSTTVTVVTGYSENNRKITRFSYNIPASVISKIRGSEQLALRYYSGPSMITVKPRSKSVKKLKQLIDLS